MRHLAAVLLAAALPCQAQVFGSDAVGFPFGTTPFGQLDWSLPQSGNGYIAISAPLLAAGCYASPTTQGNLPITVTRATAANSSDNSQSCASGELPVESDGMSSWHVATNFVLNSSTHPKTSQATASIASSATPYVAWHEGSGTMTLVNGTATTTGLSCSGVSAGTICSFTVTGTGTLTITTTAGTTHAQIELATCAACLYKSPRVASTGTAGVRNAQAASFTATISALNLYPTNKWCVSITAKPYRPWVVTGLLAHPWMFGTSGAANTAYLMTTSGNLVFNVVDSAGTGATQTWAMSGLADNSAHRIVGCNNAGSLSMCIDGVRVGGPTGAGTALWNANPAGASTIGSGNATNRHWDGDVSGFKICKGATKCSDCP